MRNSTEMRIEKETLCEDHMLNEINIRDLVQKGLLAMHRAVGSYLFSIPNCGEFAKEFVTAKNTLLAAIRKSKFGELHQSELERRSLLKSQRLPFAYVVFELIGSNHVQRYIMIIIIKNDYYFSCVEIYGYLRYMRTHL